MSSVNVPGVRSVEVLASGPRGKVVAGVRSTDGEPVVVHLLGRVDGVRRRAFLADSRRLVGLPRFRHVTPVLDAGVTVDGVAYLVTPRRAGSLADRLLSTGPLPVDLVARAARHAAAGLSSLYAEGLLHANLAPASLLLADDDTVEVTGMLVVGPDLADADEWTEHQPPEVIEGGNWTVRGEVYALASTLHTLLAGELPYAAAGSNRLLQVLAGPPPVLSRMDVPEHVTAVLRTALSRDPDVRPANPGELATAISDAVGATVTAPTSLAMPSSVPTDLPSDDRGWRSLGEAYEYRDRIGRGAVADVYRARRRADGTPVAVKLLQAHLAGRADVQMRFLRERHVSRTVDHPNLVRIHSLVVDEDDGVCALVMDLVEGPNLRTYLGRRSLPIEVARPLLLQVAAALAALHASGIVHRDLKPENVLVEKSEAGPVAKVTDFGLARTEDTAQVTQQGEFVGTWAYVAPEVVEGLPAGPDADIYSFGVLAYEVMAGRRPFSGDRWSVLRAHAEQSPPRPDGIPDDLWSLVAACLAKDPDSRPRATDLGPRLLGLAAAPPQAHGQPSVVVPRSGAAVTDAPDGQRDSGIGTGWTAEPAAPPPLTSVSSRRRPALAPPLRLLAAIALVGAFGVVVIAASQIPRATPPGVTTSAPTPSSGAVVVPQPAGVRARRTGERVVEIFLPATPGWSFTIERESRLLTREWTKSTWTDLDAPARRVCYRVTAIATESCEQGFVVPACVQPAA